MDSVQEWKLCQEEKFLKEIYLGLLKEEYIITQHPEYLKSTQTSSETAYSAYSKVKYVEYFSYTPTKSSDANKINEKLEASLNTLLDSKNAADDKMVSKDEFKELVTTDFEPVVSLYKINGSQIPYASIFSFLSICKNATKSSWTASA